MFQAPSSDAVRTVNEAGHFPLDRITDAVLMIASEPKRCSFKETSMITAPSVKPAQLRVALAAGAALLCTGLGACSGTSATAVTAPGAQKSGTSTSPGTSAPATSPASPSPTAGTATGPSHPCALLDQAEAVSSVGEPLGPRVESAQGTAGTCLYKSGNDSAFVALTVTSWDALKSFAHRSGATSVSSVGDEALTFTDAAGSQLVVRSGSVGFRLLIHGPNIDSLPDHGLAKEKALTALILPRL